MKKAPLTNKTRRQNRPQTNGNDFDTGQLLAALMAFKRGDFSARLPENWTGVPGKIADTFNEVIEANERMTRELERIGRVVGKEGRIAQRASIGEVTNSWADAIGSINNLDWGSRSTYERDGASHRGGCQRRFVPNNGNRNRRPPVKG